MGDGTLEGAIGVVRVEREWEAKGSYARTGRNLARRIRGRMAK